MTFKDLLSDDDLKKLLNTVKGSDKIKKEKIEKPTKTELSEDIVNDINSEYLERLANKK